MSFSPHSTNNRTGQMGLVNSMLTRLRYRRRPPLIQSPYRPQSASASSRGRIGAILFHFSKRTTLHGVNHMAQAKNTRSRCFWIFIVLCASLGFTINMYCIIEKYVQIPILTNVFHEAEDFQFPDISFCNLNPIYFPPEGSKAYDNLFNHIYTYNSTKNDRKTTRQNIRSLSDYLYVQRRSYSHPPWSFIIRCSYQGYRCNWRHFDVRTIWPYGNCYTLNVTRMNRERRVNPQVTYRGFRPNFQVILYKGLNYPEYFREDAHADIAMPSGIILMIHDAGSYPHIGDSYLVDTCTIVGLKIVRKIHLEKLRKCDPIERFYSYADTITKKNTTVKGNWADCIYFSLQMHVYKHCKCLMELYPIPSELSSVPFCKNPKLKLPITYLYKCLSQTFSTMKSLNLNQCYRDPCRHDSYSTVISNARYPAVVEQNSHMEWLRQLRELELRELANFNRSDLGKKALRQSVNSEGNLSSVSQQLVTIDGAIRGQRIDLLDIDFVERNFMMLRVVPSSLFMDLVEESEEYPLSRLMSDIGGCVGLWVGASLITLFEVIDLTLDLCEGLGSIRQQTSLMRAHRRAMSARSPQNSLPATGICQHHAGYNGLVGSQRGSLTCSGCVGSSGGGGGIGTIIEHNENNESPTLSTLTTVNQTSPFIYQYSAKLNYVDEDLPSNCPEMHELLTELDSEYNFQDQTGVSSEILNV